MCGMMRITALSLSVGMVSIGLCHSTLAQAQSPVETPAPAPAAVEKAPAATPAPEAPKPPPPKAYTNPSSTDDDYVIQGEYIGQADDKRFGAQIMALGDGNFEAVSYQGGLPGDGWDQDRTTVKRTKGSRESGEYTVIFKNEEYQGEVDGNNIFVTTPHNKSTVMEMQRVNRISPTDGAPAPTGAVVLFDGKGINQFPGSRVTEDGLLMEGAKSSDTFKDFTIHIEFRLPYTPTGRGQARGNSGIYLQGRYEIQMLDSFGLEGKDNECGGLYKIAVPRQNMCYPPLRWQTYDIDFTAAKFDAEGKKTSNAKVTVKHNGVTIHENQEIPEVTGGATLKEETDTPGPIVLQDHKNPVRYRNIWVLPQ